MINAMLWSPYPGFTKYKITTNSFIPGHKRLQLRILNKSRCQVPLQFSTTSPAEKLTVKKKPRSIIDPRIIPSKPNLPQYPIMEHILLSRSPETKKIVTKIVTSPSSPTPGHRFWFSGRPERHQGIHSLLNIILSILGLVRITAVEAAW